MPPPYSVPSRDSTFHLLDLPLIIVRTIFEWVYQYDGSLTSHTTLRLVSRAFRRESERLPFRSIALGHGPESTSLCSKLNFSVGSKIRTTYSVNMFAM
ncbi:hypothetical protein BU23DRAFT_315653 [Bimuria novae-zelandiae CBS 107.79]|uniref:F-box domain-containing protein n=1 Tax=Bimuria novae-zelandiae CBS 107.79 TaxID=1447943 RepID=A0A6A5UNV3_9PLEO|nr:hypothetical protein BU23DRAFT_315653 [Bimuria novae-zelandiae CBS 107.79]